MSRLPVEVFLALRYLRPKRTFVSVITLISIIGVTLGVAVLIIVISVMTGFDRELRDKILGFNAHLKVMEAQMAPMQGYRKAMETVRSHPEVTGVAPFIMGPVLLETQPEEGSSRIRAPYIRGTNPKLESQVSVLPESIVRGEYNLRGKGILVGEELAFQLGLQVGDPVAIYSPDQLRKMRSELEQGKELERVTPPSDFVVKGIFDVGHYEYNLSIIACSLMDAQLLYGLYDADAVHGLHVMVKDPFKSEQVRDELIQSLDKPYAIRTWQEENSGILDALVVEKQVMFYLLFFIMIVAAFGIMGTLIAFVVQKTREIGILKALGATSFQIMGLFLSQSILVGVIGVTTGFGLGLLALSYRNGFLDLMNRLTGFELFPAEIYTFSRLPAEVIPSDLAIICGGAMVMCLLAGLLPSWNAGRLQPVDALRHE